MCDNVILGLRCLRKFRFANYSFKRLKIADVADVADESNRGKTETAEKRNTPN